MLKRMKRGQCKNAMECLGPSDSVDCEQDQPGQRDEKRRCDAHVKNIRETRGISWNSCLH